MLHLIKLCVGPKDLATLRARQAERQRLDPPLRHLTRQAPKRAAELLEGGSLYWVMAGLVAARQRLVDIRAETGADGTPHTALVLDAEVIPVSPRAQKPFQGWRYLDPAAAPPDLGAPGSAIGLEAMPESLRRELRQLGLI